MTIQKDQHSGWYAQMLFVHLLVPAFLFFILSSSTCNAEVKESFFPPLPEGKKYQLAWHDEFEGEKLDLEKWNVHDGPRRDGFWRPDAVYLDGEGNLVIKIFRDGDKFIDGAIDTKGKYEPRFGYYVARAQLHKQPGHWSAFWLMSDGICAEGKRGMNGTEIDIFEKIDQSDTVLHNLHWDCYCGPFCHAGTEREVPGVMEGFHTFALLWTPKRYIFYVDGKMTWETDAGGVNKTPDYVFFSDEIGTWAGDIKDAELPDYFIVDYVRVYDVVDE